MFNFLFHPIFIYIYFSLEMYAVARGRKIGVFNTFNECQSSILGYIGAKYKKFNVRRNYHTIIYNFFRIAKMQLNM